MPMGSYLSSPTDVAAKIIGLRTRIASGVSIHIRSSNVYVGSLANSKAACMRRLGSSICSVSRVYSFHRPLSTALRTQFLGLLRIGKVTRHGSTLLPIGKHRKLSDLPTTSSSGQRNSVPRVADSKSRTRFPVSANILKKKQYLGTFEKLDYESDILASTFQGKRLVDYEEHAQDQSLWSELIGFRRRIHGLSAVKPLWDGLRQRKITINTQLPYGEKIWSQLVELGLEDHEVLRELIEYAKLQVKADGQFGQFYFAVIKHFLRNDLDRAYQWHKVLKDFPPDRRQCIALFNQCCRNTRALEVFKKLYIELPQVGLYSTVIDKLVRGKMLTEATAWHWLLMEKGDLPASASVVQPLIQHHILKGQVSILAQIRKGLLDAGVPLASSLDVTFENKVVISRRMMNEVHAAFYNFAPKEFSDSFCARLFATNMFSVQTIIKGLHMLGVQTIGDLSLRELVRRTISNEECETKSVHNYLKQLHEAGISVGSSMFSKVVSSLTTMRQAQILYDVVTCDQHSEVFEDRNVQESLLAGYQDAGDQRQINRTLAILTCTFPKEVRKQQQLNVLFRSCLTRKDLNGLQEIIEKMLDEFIPLHPRSRTYMWHSLVTKRQPSRGPGTTKELPSLVNAWKNFMSAGTRIEPADWVEILRRLGMSGELEQYENLALWLARWYSDVDFRKSQEGLVARRRSFTRRAIPLQPSYNSRNAHKILFPKEGHQAILAWGFLQPHNSKVKGRTTAEQVQELANCRWLWGVRMLAKLRDCGVTFKRSDVKRACTLRLISLFGEGISDRPQNRRSQRKRKGSIEAYMLAMEAIWSRDLFVPEIDGLSEMEKRRQRRDHAVRIIETVRPQRGGSEGHGLRRQDPRIIPRNEEINRIPKVRQVAKKFSQLRMPVYSTESEKRSEFADLALS